MKQRFANFLAELEKRKTPLVPARIDRSHFLNATDPIEARLTRALQQFPPSELGFLIMSFGLDSHNPKAPQAVAEAMGMLLVKVLDIGTGAEFRLRNRQDTRALIEAIAGQEVMGLARYLEVISRIRDERRQRAATELWYYGHTPLRRLAMSTALEGGFGAFLKLVRDGAKQSPGLSYPSGPNRDAEISMGKHR